MRWTLLVPVKGADAKRRLASTLPPGTAASVHAALVAALRADALSAAAATPQVARILVVTDTAGAQPGVLELVQRTRGLNGALRDGAAYARHHWAAEGVAALVGDLPALRSAELGAALDAAAGHPAAFVPDAEGTGTTLLTARPGTVLAPRFGAGSAARHRRHAAELDAGPGLRRDVDTAADLQAALALGLGPATTAACDVMTGLLRRAMMSG